MQAHFASIEDLRLAIKLWTRLQRAAIVYGSDPLLKARAMLTRRREPMFRFGFTGWRENGDPGYPLD